jgi:hypothetical protein
MLIASILFASLGVGLYMSYKKDDKEEKDYEYI